MTTTTAQTTQPSIDQEVANFRQQYYATNPEHTAEQAATAARAYRDQVVQRRIESDPGIAAMQRRQREREDAQRAAQQQAIEDSERRVQEAGAAELERERQGRRAAFIAAGGTDTEFAQQWPEMRRRLLVERTEANAHQSQRATAERVRGLWQG